MRGSKLFRIQVIAMVCVSLILPQAVMAATPAHKVQISDVVLADGGMLLGQVVDQQGVGKGGAQIVVLQQGREPVRTVTDHSGSFRAAGLSGGTAQVVTEGGQGVYRLWTAHAAPPIAQGRALLITGGQVVRGQACYDPCSGGIGQWILPALAAGGIIAGVAVATSNTSSASP